MPTRAIVLLLLATVLTAHAQTQSRSFVGTVSSMNDARTEMQVKSESGELRSVTLTDGTALQQVAPGDRDLKNARPLGSSGLQAGDRVLITIEAANLAVARRSS